MKMADRHGLPKVVTSARGAAHVISVSGRLRGGDGDAIAAAVASVSRGGSAVVIDLSGALLIDASIARVLRQSCAACAREGVSFAAVAACGQPLEVLEVLGLAKEFGADRTVAEALAEAESVRGARQSLDATVHHLLAATSELDSADPRRRDAQHRAISVALPLARSMAHRYQQRGEPLEDLIQVASLGVVRAVQGYDPARGSGFLAYAVPTILGELKRHFRDHVWTVRAPRKLQEIRTTITGAMPELAQELGREPTPADIAAHTGFATGEVEQAILTGSGLRPTSLDAPVAGDTERCLHEMVGTPDAEVDMVDFRASIEPMIAAQSAVVREILTLRFASDCTQAEIAARLGTSQMNVSRVLRATLDKFRRALLSAG